MMIVEDNNFLIDLINNVFNDNEEEFLRLKNGEMKLIGFFMGQIMKEAKGKVDPKAVQEIIKKIILEKQ